MVYTKGSLLTFLATVSRASSVEEREHCLLSNRPMFYKRNLRPGCLPEGRAICLRYAPEKDPEDWVEAPEIDPDWVEACARDYCTYLVAPPLEGLAPENHLPSKMQAEDQNPEAHLPSAVRAEDIGPDVDHTHNDSRALAWECSPEVEAMLASAAAYDSGPFLADTLREVKQSLASAGFDQVKRFDVSSGKCKTFFTNETVRDQDVAVLWKHEGDNRCMLAFRGSDCFGDSFASTPASIFKYGYHINQYHLEHEFEPLLAAMSAADFSDCSSLDVTGFSMGGALATIFAVLSNADELELGTTVNRLYAMAPVPMFYGDMVTNKKSEDGCFAGGVYCNYVDEGGAPRVDGACLLPGYTFPKTSFVKLGAATGTTACADVTKQTSQLTPAAKAFLPAHAYELYINGLGCAEAELSFNSSEYCKQEHVAPFC